MYVQPKQKPLFVNNVIMRYIIILEMWKLGDILDDI